MFLPLTPPTAAAAVALQVVFRNYLVCKTLSANIDFGNLYKKRSRRKAEKKKTKRQRLRDIVAALGDDSDRPRGQKALKSRSILFGALYRCNAMPGCSDIKSLAH